MGQVIPQETVPVYKDRIKISRLWEYTSAFKALSTGMLWSYASPAIVIESVNNRGDGDLRRHRAHYDVIVMLHRSWHIQNKTKSRIFCILYFQMHLKIKLLYFDSNFTTVIFYVFSL